jgi:hypothetical protein
VLAVIPPATLHKGKARARAAAARKRKPTSTSEPKKRASTGAAPPGSGGAS